MSQEPTYPEAMPPHRPVLQHCDPTDLYDDPATPYFDESTQEFKPFEIDPHAAIVDNQD